MEEEATGTIELRQYAAILLRWLWLIIVGTLLAGAAAYVASSFSTPIYEATATLVINEGQKATGPDYNSILMSERLAKTYAQLLKERPVLQEASARLAVPLQRDDIVVTPERDTQLLRLTARSPDPTLAAAIANTIPLVFIEQTEASRAARYSGSQESLSRELQALQGEMEATQRALEAERARPLSSAAEVARLETLLAQHRSTYAGLLQSYEEMRLAEARAADTLTVFTPAAVPVRPVLPRTRQNTLLAAVVGAMLAAGAAFLIEYLDDTVKRAEDVERATGLPTLATVFRFDPAQLEGGGPLMLAEPQSAAAEAYRLLRTNLQFATLAADGGAPVVVVTSPQPQDGKSTTLANLGVGLAQIGKRVLLVDCDLRAPSLHRLFGLRNETGLTTLFLRREAGVEQVMQETGVPGLRIITAGPLPANPAEVLDFPQTATLIQQLKALADYVLLDSPPVLSAADASILARHADGVLLVADTGHTRAGALKSAVLTLERVQARLAGVVLNKAAAQRSGDYAYYGYHGYYGGNGSGRRRMRRTSPGRPAARSEMRRRRLGRLALLLGGNLLLLSLLAAVAYAWTVGSERPASAAPTQPAPVAGAPVAGATDVGLALPRGLAASLRLRDGRAAHAPGEQVALVIELENPTAAALSLGLVGLQGGVDVPFHASASDLVVGAHSTVTVEDALAFAGPGDYSLRVAACFSPSGACAQPGADWFEFSPGLTVAVR